MTLSNEYYFLFEIRTLFESGDHPETGDYSTVFIAAMLVWPQPHRGLCVGDIHSQSYAP
jgi:hypothetical protein